MIPNQFNILVACEFSGVVRNAFIQRGFNAISCDLIPSESNKGPHHQGDILELLNNKYMTFDLMIAHPPCTYLTSTGAKWFYHPEDSHLPTNKRRPHPKFPNRKQDQQNAIDFFMQLTKADIPHICIENPVGIMSTYYRKPDQIIQPYEYGHSEPKKTCLWLKNLPKLKPTNIIEPEYHITKSGKRVPAWFFLPSQSEKRTKDRQRTFPGIAEAMALQWGNYLLNQINEI